MAPIHDAARSANATMLRRVLESGVSPDALAADRTPIHLLCLSRNACMNGDRAACFKLLREAGANLEATNSIGMTPLHEAAANGRLELLSLLIQSGVNVNATHMQGKNALHFAVQGSAIYSRKIACCELLLKAGAAVNVKAHGWQTPLNIALTCHLRRMWPLFLRAGAEMPNHTVFTYPYIERVRNAGGFKRYEQAHLARLTAILETPLLPPELVRKILEFWLHAGYY